MNNVKPTVSVIIPVYNSQNSISKTIESVLMQTFTNYEIIVINDGSIDDSLGIINSYVEKHSNICVYSQRNSGVSSARNNGMRFARGKYISFLDSDDLFEPEFLDELIKAISINNSDYCYCGYSNSIDNIKYTNSLSNFDSDNPLKDYILGKLKLHTSTWLIKSNYLKNNNITFSEDSDWGEDFEFFCKVLALSNNWSYVPLNLSIYVNDENENRLSHHNLNKISKDFELIKRISRNPNINSSKDINAALFDYKLVGSIVYRLLSSIQNNDDKNEVMCYHSRYSEYIKLSMCNGLRSLKLNLAIIKLKVLLLMLK